MTAQRMNHQEAVNKAVAGVLASSTLYNVFILNSLSRHIDSILIVG